MPRTKKTPSAPVAAVTEKDDAKKKRVRHSYLYAVGRRKKAIARVRLIKGGSGTVTVNGRAYTEYFPSVELQKTINQPLEATSKQKDFDFSIKVSGGGSHGQAEAARHGIARTLLLIDKDLRPLLKAQNLLRRDPRRKERKKPGLRRARRAPQFSKR